MHIPDDNTVTGMLILPGGGSIRDTGFFIAVVNLT